MKAYYNRFFGCWNSLNCLVLTMADAEGKRLTELRVIDLKNELERRGLDKTGNKAALLDRLSKVIY